MPEEKKCKNCGELFLDYQDENSYYDKVAMKYYVPLPKTLCPKCEKLKKEG